MSAPTYPAAQDLAEGTGTRAFSAVTTQANDYLVVEIISESDAVAYGTASPSGGSLTYNLENDTTVGAGSDVRIWQYVALDSTGASRTVTVTPTSGSTNYRARVTVVRGSTGPGGKGVIKTSRQVSVAREGDNSGMFMAVGDWSAGSVGTPTWTPGGSTMASQQGSAGTYFFGRWDDSGTAATVAHGLSSPSPATPAAAVLEMLGSTSAGEEFGAAALAGTGTLTASASVSTTGAVALASASTLAVSAIVTTTGTVALASASTLAVAGSVTVLGSSAMASTSTLTAAGTTAPFGAAVLTGAGTLTVAGTTAPNGAAVLNATSALTVSGIVTALGAVLTAGTSTLAVAATVSTTGAAALNSTGAMTVDSSVSTTGTAALTGVSVLSVSGEVAGDNSAMLSAVASLAVAASVTVFASAALTGQLALNVTGMVTTTGAATLTGVSALTAAGNTVETHTGEATLTAVSTMVVAGTATPPWVWPLLEVGTITVVGYDVDTGSLSDHHELSTIYALGWEAA